MSLFPDLYTVLSSEDSARILTPEKVFGKMGCALLQFIVILVAVLLLLLLLFGGVGAGWGGGGPPIF